jgi:hypothetical protein
MHMLRKGQFEGIAQGDVLPQNRLFTQLFGFTASREFANLSSPSNQFLQYNRGSSRRAPHMAPSNFRSLTHGRDNGAAHIA